jgi:hypothetical protein
VRTKLGSFAFVVASTVLAAIPLVIWVVYTATYWSELAELVRVGAFKLGTLLYSSLLYPLLLLACALGALLKRTWWLMLGFVGALGFGLVAHSAKLWPAAPAVGQLVSTAGLCAGAAATLSCFLSMLSTPSQS